MSKGSRVYTLRLPPELDAAMHREIASQNANSRGEPWGPSLFLAAAVVEFLRKRKAGRAPRPGRRKRKGVAP